MRSFAVIAAISALGAQATPGYYPVYEVSSSAPAYGVYPTGYVPSSAASSSVASSSAASSTPVYVTSTKVVPETTYVCPTPTVVTYEEKTYSVTQATTLTISSYTTTTVISKTPEAAVSSPAPVYSASVPAPPAPYPSTNGTVPYSPVAPQGTATSVPTTTKPSTPEFTGAAAQAGVGLLAVVGALAAFL